MFWNWQLLHCMDASPALFYFNMLLNLLRRLVVLAGQLAGFFAADDAGQELGHILNTASPFDANGPRGHLPRRLSIPQSRFLLGP